MDWLKAASFVALGMMTAIRNGFGASVGAGAAVGASVATGAEVGGAAAGVGVAAGPHAVASMAINNSPAYSNLVCFIFFLL
jgi:hypothetical protein